MSALLRSSVVASPSRRRTSLVVLLPLLVAVAARAQRPAGPEPEMAVHVFELRHQPAREALPLVLPLLSPHGSVEVRQAANTLVVRDQLAALAKIVPVVRGFDHPARPLQVTVALIQARPRAAVSPLLPPGASLDRMPRVLSQLRSHLPYEHYELVAESSASGQEGEQVGFDLSDDWQVSFRLGTVLAEQRIRLTQFAVARQRQAGDGTLLRSNLNVWLDRPSVLVLTSDPSSKQALLVVIECRLTAVAER